jgi:MerR family transcriptional regulator, light-induced transcriptional regulator
VALELDRNPEIVQIYGESVRTRMLEDTGYHLAYLAQAIAVESVELFGAYISWARVMLAKRGVPEKYLNSLLASMKESAGSELPAELVPMTCQYLDAALGQLSQAQEEPPSFIVEGSPLSPLATAYLQALLRGERHVASQLILDAVEHGVAVRDLYLQVFECSQREIGRLWQINQISVAQEHYCTAATQLIMSQLYPHIFSAEKTGRTVVATGVAGDLHEVGARVVCDFFEMDGWRTHYLGTNVPAPSVVQAVVRGKADVLVISATISYHVAAVAGLIAAVRREPGCRGVTVLVGGYPFKVVPDLWKTVGADGSAGDAPGAVALANRLSVASRSP